MSAGNLLSRAEAERQCRAECYLAQSQREPTRTGSSSSSDPSRRWRCSRPRDAEAEPESLPRFDARAVSKTMADSLPTFARASIDAVGDGGAALSRAEA